jgi:hypothetical protein
MINLNYFYSKNIINLVDKIVYHELITSKINLIIY